MTSVTKRSRKCHGSGMELLSDLDSWQSRGHSARVDPDLKL